MLSSLLVTVICLLGVARSFADSVHHHFSSLQYRNLNAAKKHADISQRADDIATRKTIVLTYAEDISYVDDTIFTSRVRLGGDRPTLFLEEFDHLLDLVECSGSTMTLRFRDISFFEKAKGACASLDEGLVISSHSSCSEVNAHSIFNITSIEYDGGNAQIILGVQETTWSRSFRSKKIEFGQSSDLHYLHKHDRLSRRQTESITASGEVASAATSLIPTATPTVESVTFDLSNDQTDTTFSWPLGVEAGPQMPITVGCKKCTTKGQLILTQGAFDLTDFDELTEQAFDPDKDMDFIKSGFFELELNGFETSVLLKAGPSASLGFAIDLFTVPVYGFKIPGFGAAGVLFQPQLVFDIGIKGGVELTWGFKVNVPDKSTIRLDLGVFNQSGITGFDQTTVEALPFNANASDIELTLKAGLRPFMPIGISFFDDKLEVLGGPFIDLPYISTTITQLATSNVNENCETGKGQSNAKFNEAFKNLTHIEAELGMEVGFEFEATADLLFDVTKRFNYTIWTTASQLPTACLAFEKDSGMVAATAASKKVNAASGLYRASSEPSGVFGAFAQFAMLGLSVMAAVFMVM